MCRFSKDARTFHRKLPVFLGYLDFAEEQFRPRGGIQCDLEKLEMAGVRTAVVSIGFGCYFQLGPCDYVRAGPDDWLLARQLNRIDRVLAAISNCPKTRLITSAEELSRQDDTVGIIVHLTGNNHTLDLSTVDALFNRGVRATHPAMPYHDRWCRGIEGIPSAAITEFGLQVIARMNEHGIVLDTAHASDESAIAIIGASAKPVIDSHTASRTKVPSCRGLPDSILRMIADAGGVVGIHFADHMLTEAAWTGKYRSIKGAEITRRLWMYNAWVLENTEDPDERIRLRHDSDKQKAFYTEHDLPADPLPPDIRGAGVGDLADSIEYLVDLVGWDHVGLGCDVNGIGCDQWPDGMDHIGHLPVLTAELLRRGYGEKEIRKLYHDNWQRVYQECLP